MPGQGWLVRNPVSSLPVISWYSSVDEAARFVLVEPAEQIDLDGAPFLRRAVASMKALSVIWMPTWLSAW
jgi:hypothetical protein